MSILVLQVYDTLQAYDTLRVYTDVVRATGVQRESMDKASGKMSAVAGTECCIVRWVPSLTLARTSIV